MPGFDLNASFGDVQSAISSGAFDPTGANFTTFGQTGMSLPALGGGARPAPGTQNNTVSASKALAIGTSIATGDPLPAIGALSGSQGSPQASASGSIFVRGAVVVLGFIFVAAGLVMFRSPLVIQNPVRS